jgi:hypothetical protein
MLVAGKWQRAYLQFYITNYTEVKGRTSVWSYGKYVGGRNTARQTNLLQLL